MIAKLWGKVAENDGPLLVLNVQGVGYGLQVLHDDQASLRLDEQVELYIYEHIKEDGHDLYGFSTLSRKQLFVSLLSVNGVGPKAALAISNSGSEVQVRAAIASGDVSFISSAVGVGKKVAERVVVDLKNKVGLGDNDQATDFLGGALVQDEATQALVSLGHSQQEAQQLLAKVDQKLPTADRVKLALKARN